MPQPSDQVRAIDAIDELDSRIAFGKHLKVSADTAVWTLTLAEAETLRAEVEKLTKELAKERRDRQLLTLEVERLTMERDDWKAACVSPDGQTMAAWQRCSRCGAYWPTASVMSYVDCPACIRGDAHAAKAEVEKLTKERDDAKVWGYAWYENFCRENVRGNVAERRADALQADVEKLRAELAESERANREERGEWSKVMFTLTGNGTYATSEIVPAVKKLLAELRANAEQRHGRSR